MKRDILFIFIFLVIPFSLGFNPVLVSQLKGKISIEGDLYITGSIQELKMNITVPQNETGQISICNATLVNVNGVKMAHLEMKHPKGSIHYKIVCRINNLAKKIKSIPRTYSTGEYSEYAQPSEGVPSDDPEIKELAERIVNGSTSDFEKMARLTQWVHDFITYDESVTGKYLTAYEILKERRGVCVEYSTLFATLARALGYPVRFVGGIAYGDKGPTGHMWVEVYLGRWVPFDPTWDLGGSLDATHIAFYKTKERKIESRIMYTGTGNVDWNIDPIFGLGSLEIENMKTEDYPVHVKEIIPARELGFSTPSFVALNLTTDRYLITPVTLATCTGESIIDIPNPVKIVFLDPHTYSLVYWEIYSRKLDPSYKYTCPLTINSDFLPIKSIDIDVQSKARSEFQVAVSDKNPEKGQKFYIYVSSPIHQRFYALYDNQLASASGRQLGLGFVAKLGSKEILVTSENGGLFKTRINVSAPEGIRIARIIYPKTVLAGQEIRLNAIIENPTNTSIPVTVTLKTKNNQKKSVLDLEGTKAVSFNLKFDSPGYYQLNVELSGEGVHDKKVAVVQVIEKPEISIEKVNSSNGLLIVKFKVNGEPVNPEIYLDGKEIPFSDTIALNLGEGKHLILVKWRDQAGNEYESSKLVEVKTSLVSSNINLFILVFIVLLAIALILVIIAVILIARFRPKMAQ